MWWGWPQSRAGPSVPQLDELEELHQRWECSAFREKRVTALLWHHLLHSQHLLLIIVLFCERDSNTQKRTFVV